MARKIRPTTLPPPYLKRLWLDEARVDDRDAYPFCLPFLRNGFEWRIESPITIIVAENGVGKSTLIEGIAAMAGDHFRLLREFCADPEGLIAATLDG